MQSQIWLRLGNFRSLFTWLLADLQFFARRSFLWVAYVTACIFAGWVIQEWKWESMPKKEATVAVFYNLISEMAYCDILQYTAFTIFCWLHILLVQCGRELHRGVNTRKQGSLGAILEAGYHSRQYESLPLAAVGKSICYISALLISLLFLSWAWMAVHVLIVPNMKLLSETTWYTVCCRTVK